jgi:hypothetical protein
MACQSGGRWGWTWLSSKTPRGVATRVAASLLWWGGCGRSSHLLLSWFLYSFIVNSSQCEREKKLTGVSRHLVSQAVVVVVAAVLEVEFVWW